SRREEAGKLSLPIGAAGRPTAPPAEAGMHLGSPWTFAERLHGTGPLQGNLAPPNRPALLPLLALLGADGALTSIPARRQDGEHFDIVPGTGQGTCTSAPSSGDERAAATGRVPATVDLAKTPREPTSPISSAYGDAVRGVWAGP